ANVEYLDANYGGTIMLFDHLFGTYVPEKDGVPIRYGLVKPMTTYSAVVVCLNEWASIFKDVAKAGSLRDALGHMFGPPGWAPQGRGMTTEGLRAYMTATTGSASGLAPLALFDGRTVEAGGVVDAGALKPDGTGGA